MTQAFRAAVAPPPASSSREDEDLPLLTAVHELFTGLRAGAADVADLVAAEARVAMRLLVAMVASAVAAAVLAGFGVAGMATAVAAELIARGMSASVAIAVLSLLSVAGSLALAFRLRGLSRRILFGYTRGHLRGGQ